MGFADKGDDYNVKWINSEATFKHLYGTPKTEAERYFYNAAMEVVDGGGTCYTAKLPYKNNSLNKFVYTSYKISNTTTPIYSIMDIQNYISCRLNSQEEDKSIENPGRRIKDLVDSIKNITEILCTISEFNVIILGDDILSNIDNYDITIKNLLEASYKLRNIIANETESVPDDTINKSTLQELYERLCEIIDYIKTEYKILNIYDYIFFMYKHTFLLGYNNYGINQLYTTNISKDFIEYFKNKFLLSIA